MDLSFMTVRHIVPDWTKDGLPFLQGPTESIAARVREIRQLRGCD